MSAVFLLQFCMLHDCKLYFLYFFLFPHTGVDDLDMCFLCFRACKNQRGKWHWGEIKWGGKTTEECNQHAIQGQCFYIRVLVNFVYSW